MQQAKKKGQIYRDESTIIKLSEKEWKSVW